MITMSQTDIEQALTAHLLASGFKPVEDAEGFVITVDEATGQLTATVYAESAPLPPKRAVAVGVPLASLRAAPQEAYTEEPPAEPPSQVQTRATQPSIARAELAEPAPDLPDLRALANDAATPVPRDLQGLLGVQTRELALEGVSPAPTTRMKQPPRVPENVPQPMTFYKGNGRAVVGSRALQPPIDPADKANLPYGDP